MSEKSINQELVEIFASETLGDMTTLLDLVKSVVQTICKMARWAVQNRPNKRPFIDRDSTLVVTMA